MRTHINLPADLVQAVDALVGDRGRSQFVAEATAKEVARVKLLRAAEAALGERPTVDVPGWESTESAARWVHDLRRADTDRQEYLDRLHGEAATP
jgi:hypothetical protein